jgi:hypothetical protein
MTTFVLYRKSDGRIVGSAKANHEDLTAFDTPETGAVIADLPDVDSFKVSPDGQIIPIDTGDFAEEDLKNRRSSALFYLRNKVSNARTKYISDFPGQDAIYQAKENEAVAYLAATNPVLSDYPLLEAETGITAATPTELANLWITLAQQWRSIAAQLEAARMTANASIASAATVADIEAALTALDTALAALPSP